MSTDRLPELNSSHLDVFPEKLEDPLTVKLNALVINKNARDNISRPLVGYNWFRKNVLVLYKIQFNQLVFESLHHSCPKCESTALLTSRKTAVFLLQPSQPNIPVSNFTRLGEPYQSHTAIRHRESHEQRSPPMNLDVTGELTSDQQQPSGISSLDCSNQIQRPIDRFLRFWFL